LLKTPYISSKFQRNGGFYAACPDSVGVLTLAPIVINENTIKK